MDVLKNLDKICEKCGSADGVKKVTVSGFSISQISQKYLCVRCAMIEKMKKY